MPPFIHGTKQLDDKQHPVLDLASWNRRFPLGDGADLRSCVNSPGDLARVEEARRLVLAQADPGPSVPADVFVWTSAEDRERPWLTRIGGVPWRDAKKAWPEDEDGIPLTFLAQISFLDSADILPFKLPGDLLLIFGDGATGSLATDPVFEWSTKELRKPATPYDVPRTGWLPFSLDGVIHRTVQYTDEERFETAFESAGDGYSEAGAIQATSIGAYASLPQGWPLEDLPGATLICTLSSFYFRGKWPLCDTPEVVGRVGADGKPCAEAFGGTDALSLRLGDAGAIWLYGDAKGKFHLDCACC